MFDNRRQNQRFYFGKPVQYRPSHVEDTSGALGRDISLGGIKMTVNDFMPLGTVLEMGLNLPEIARQVIVKGKVVWIRENSYSERFEIGVEFLPDHQTAGVVAAYLKKQQG